MSDERTDDVRQHIADELAALGQHFDSREISNQEALAVCALTIGRCLDAHLSTGQITQDDADNAIADMVRTVRRAAGLGVPTKH